MHPESGRVETRRKRRGGPERMTERRWSLVVGPERVGTGLADASDS